MVPGHHHGGSTVNGVSAPVSPFGVQPGDEILLSRPSWPSAAARCWRPHCWGCAGPHQVRYALARGHQITLFNRGVPRAGDDGALLRRSNAKAIAAGLTFRPLGETATDTLEWFRQQTPQRQAALKTGLSPERERKVLTDWRASLHHFKPSAATVIRICHSRTSVRRPCAVQCTRPEFLSAAHCLVRCAKQRRIQPCQKPIGRFTAASSRLQLLLRLSVPVQCPADPWQLLGRDRDSDRARLFTAIRRWTVCGSPAYSNIRRPFIWVMAKRCPS